jgi:AraC-like DNA-binding protein
MNIVFIIGIIESLFFYLILISKKKKSQADIILSIWLLILSINIFIPIFTYNDHLKYIRLNGIDYGLLIFHPIFLYIYTKSLIAEEKKIKIRYSIYIPVLIINWILIIPYILMDKETKLDFLYHSKFPVIVWIGTLWVNIIFVVYLFLAGRLVIKHQKHLKSQYSYPEYENLEWLKYLIIGFSIIYLLGSLLGGILCYLKIPLFYINYYVYVTIVLFVFGLGYFGIRHKNVFTNNNLKEKKLINRKSVAITEQDELFAEKIRRYMVLSKPYLNEKLTLQDLAALLKVKPYYITFILNHVINKKFYDFVNYYRIQEIKKRIDNGEIVKYTLLSIAYDCGFNSKASFNRIFKSFTGNSPTEYIESFTHSSEE